MKLFLLAFLSGFSALVYEVLWLFCTSPCTVKNRCAYIESIFPSGYPPVNEIGCEVAPQHSVVNPRTDVLTVVRFEMTLRLYGAINYSQNSAYDLRSTLNGA